MRSRNFVVAVLPFLVVLSAVAHVPLIHQGLIPASIAPGSPAFTLTVHGAGFKPTAVVNWNGSPRLTEVISANELKATINASDVSARQTAWITVTNPGPRGGTSNIIFFPVTVQQSSIGMSVSTPLLTSYSSYFIAGDFNGDGKLDLAWMDTNSILNVALGNGNGTFQTAISSGTEFAPLAVGDFNNDGKLDLVGLYGNAVYIMLGNGDGTFSLKSLVGGGEYAIAVADFNQDGNLDLSVPQNRYTFQIYLGNGDGTFTAGAVYGQNINFSTAVAGDFNGDGKVDLAASGYLNGWQTYIFLGNGDGTFELSGTGSYVSSAAADMNHDGKLDLVGDSGCTDLGNGDGTFIFSGCGASEGEGNLLGIGDFNGDGDLDVFESDNQVIVLPGAGNGQYLSPFLFYPTQNLTFNSGGAVGDFNNDGHLDVIYNGQFVPQIPVSFSTNQVFFNPQNVGTTSSPQTVTVANVGWGGLPITKIVIAGTNAPSFAQTNTCGTNLAANATCTISVTFTPKKGGNLAGTLIVGYKGLGSPQTISLVGTGLVPPTVSLKPATLNFGVQVVVTSGAAQTATLTNTGNQPVAISSIAASGAFTQTNNCPSSLGVGGTCQIQVTFTPTAIGITTGTLTVIDNAAKSPQTVSLGGAGTVMTLSPLGVNFGNQKVGTTSAAAPFTLTNVGTSSVSINLINITGTNPGDFSQTNNCGNTLAAKASCTMNVTFKPTATGARSASLSVSDNGGGSPPTVPLTGTGT